MWGVGANVHGMHFIGGQMSYILFILGGKCPPCQSLGGGEGGGGGQMSYILLYENYPHLMFMFTNKIEVSA